MYAVDETKGEYEESKQMHTYDSKVQSELNKLRSLESRDDIEESPNVIFNTQGINQALVNVDDEKGQSRVNTSHFSKRKT